MPTSISTQNRFSSWAAIPLRLIVGYGFIEHGFAKLLRGPESFTDILHAIGIPAASLMAWATILIEIFGGLAVLLGARIALVSVPMAVVLLVAIFTVHPLRLQLDQAAGGDSGGCAVRAAGL